MEPPRTAVKALGRDASEAPQEALDLAGRLRGNLARSAATGSGDSRTAAVSSSLLKTQSRNRTRSISLSPMSNANRELVQQACLRIAN